MRHELVEGAPQRCNVASRVEAALTKDGVQLDLLVFAHQCSFDEGWITGRQAAGWSSDTQQLVIDGRDGLDLARLVVDDHQRRIHRGEQMVGKRISYGCGSGGT
jgi:hypothetical protein